MSYCPEFRHAESAIETRRNQKKWRKAAALNATSITIGARRGLQSTASAFPNSAAQLNCTFRSRNLQTAISLY